MSVETEAVFNGHPLVELSTLIEQIKLTDRLLACTSSAERVDMTRREAVDHLDALADRAQAALRRLRQEVRKGYPSTVSD